MQDLVRVGVADAAQDAGIGQRALERVILAGQRAVERGRVGVEHLEPARIVLGEARLAADEIERRAPLRTGLGQDERARREIERGQADLAAELGARGLPVEPPGDHQVQHQEQIALEADHDALAEAREPDDTAAGRRRDRRIDRAKQERAREPHALEGRAHDPRLERLDVDGDVGQLRHPRLGESETALHQRPRVAVAAGVHGKTLGVRERAGAGAKRLLLVRIEQRR